MSMHVDIVAASLAWVVAFAWVLTGGGEFPRDGWDYLSIARAERAMTRDLGVVNTSPR